MSRDAFESLRLPLAALLIVIAAAFVLWPRDPGEPAAAASPSASVVVGPVGGAVVAPSAAPVTSRPSVAASAAPSDTPEPTVAATPEPATPAPAADGFTAEILACESITGATCNGQLGTLPSGAGTFTALVRFTSATAGDQMNAVLSGPSGPIAGFPYTLQGSGDGYYYSQFQAGGLPAGTYTLTATRNGQEVAVTTFTKAG